MRWRARWITLWRDILATFAEFDHYLVRRYKWFTERSIKRVVNRVIASHQFIQLLVGAVFVWLVNRMPTDATGALVVHIGDAVWAIIAGVNVWQLLRGLNGGNDGDNNGRWRWRRGDEPPNTPTPPGDLERQPERLRVTAGGRTGERRSEGG